jgi:hypothetical protein
LLRSSTKQLFGNGWSASWAQVFPIEQVNVNMAAAKTCVCDVMRFIIKKKPPAY